LPQALENSDVVVIPAGVPRKPGMTRDDLFNVNAGIVANVAKHAATSCPNAMFLIITNPVNSMVPIFSEVMTRQNAFNPRKIIGVTTLDVLRTKTFVAQHHGWKNPERVRANVIGGHAGITILPLLSQIRMEQNVTKFSEEDIAKLTHRIMFGGDEVVKAKDGAGSATLSMAYAGAYLTRRVLEGLSGSTPIECCYVNSRICKDPEVTYFASPVKFGKEGIAEIFNVGSLSKFEEQKYNEMIPELKEAIKKGIEFGRNYNLK